MNTNSISSVVSGKVVEILEREEYMVKKTGELKQKLTFILDRESKYESKIAITMFGEDTINKAAQIFKLEDIISCEVIVSSSPWNDRWFNNIRYVSSTKI